MTCPTRPRTCGRSPAKSAGWASLSDDELYVAAKELQAPHELVVEVARAGKLPVTLFTAGGIATPADAAMMMQLGAEGVFVGSGIFKSDVAAAARRRDRQGDNVLRRSRRAGRVSRGLGAPMVGINVEEIAPAAPTCAARLVILTHVDRRDP